jgi:hypothetical protein
MSSEPLKSEESANGARRQAGPRLTPGGELARALDVQAERRRLLDRLEQVATKLAAARMRNLASHRARLETARVLTYLTAVELSALKDYQEADLEARLSALERREQPGGELGPSPSLEDTLKRYERAIERLTKQREDERRKVEAEN